MLMESILPMEDGLVNRSCDLRRCESGRWEYENIKKSPSWWRNPETE